MLVEDGMNKIYICYWVGEQHTGSITSRLVD